MVFLLYAYATMHGQTDIKFPCSMATRAMKDTLLSLKPSWYNNNTRGCDSEKKKMLACLEHFNWIVIITKWNKV